MDAVLALFVDDAVILVLGVQPAARRAQHDAGPGREFARERQAGLRHRLACRDQGELGEPVIKRDLLAVEMIVLVVAAYLRADLHRQAIHVTDVEWTDGTTPLAECLQSCRDVRSQGVDGARPGDRHAAAPRRMTLVRFAGRAPAGHARSRSRTSA